jgi:hypothetical protein
MTEIRFEPAHFALKFFEQQRNKATKTAKLCSFVALLFNHSALERLFSGIHFGLDEWGERGRPACGFGRRARTIVGQISLLDGFSAGRRKRQPGRSRSPDEFRRGNGARGAAHEAGR